MKNFKLNNKILYWGLIFTFFALYICVGFVSTLHSITFFHLANNVGLAILLGITYELGQSTVLFSILMTKNKDKFLPWALMILLTALQVSANVFASFKYMVSSGSNDWVYWQKSILFGVQAATPEMYQVIISWISGALLPVVALGMTALVANNMKLMSDENEVKGEEVKEPEIEDEVKGEEVKEEAKEEAKEENAKKSEEEYYSNKKTEVIEKLLNRENYLENLANSILSNAGPATRSEENPIIGEGGVQVVRKPVEIDLLDHEEANKEFEEKYFSEGLTPTQKAEKEIEEIIEKEVQKRLKEKKEEEKQKQLEEYEYIMQEESEYLYPEEGESPEIISIEKEKIKEDVSSETSENKTPITKTRGWHLKKNYIDSNGDIYHFGKFQEVSPLFKEPQEPKKA